MFYTVSLQAKVMKVRVVLGTPQVSEVVEKRKACQDGTWNNH